MGSAASGPPAASGELTPLRVLAVRRETAEAKSFVLEVPAAQAERFRYRAGQYLSVELPWGEFAIRRCYSLSSDPGSDEPPTLTVKRVPGGRASNWMLDQLEAGASLSCAPPQGAFVSTKPQLPLVAFAGGSGITPIYSLIKHALRTSARAITLLHANRSPEAAIFGEALAALAARHPERLQVLDHHDCEAGLLRPEAVAERLAGRPELAEAELFACGPAPFLRVIEDGLRLAGVPEGRLAIERFVSPVDPDAATTRADARAAGAEAAAPGTVRVTLGGRRHHLDYRPGDTLLETCKKHGLDAPRSCEDGYCGSCMAVLKYGDADPGDPRALTQADRARGRVLACQLRPASDLPFAITFDEADFRREADGVLGTDAPSLSRYRAVLLLLLLSGAALAVRQLHHIFVS